LSVTGPKGETISSVTRLKDKATHLRTPGCSIWPYHSCSEGNASSLSNADLVIRSKPSGDPLETIWSSAQSHLAIRSKPNEVAVTRMIKLGLTQTCPFFTAEAAENAEKRENLRALGVLCGKVPPVCVSPESLGLLYHALVLHYQVLLLYDSFL